MAPPGTTAATTIPATTTTPTTTTVPETTTTVEAFTWAPLPLIETGFGSLGWWDGTEWVAPLTVEDLPVSGGEDYQIAVFNLEGTIKGGPPTLVCEPLDIPGVELEEIEPLGAWPGPAGVAISAPWELKPHLVEEFTDDGTYAALAADLLASRGMVVATPKIKQLLRFDLEGDGVNEVLVVAEDVPVSIYADGDDYSIVFMRKVVQGEVQTAVLGESLVPDPGTDLLVSFSVGAVADLNGDGKMEIIVNGAYYEGMSWDLWEYVNDDLGPVLQLQTGCGA